MINFLEKKRYIAITLTILIAIEIFYFSSLSGGIGGKGGIPFLATIYHFIIFFLFNFFVLVSIKGNQKLKISHILIAISVSIIYSISDEIHQIFVPFRDSSIRDILTNSVGIFSSILIYFYINQNKK